MRRSVLLTLFSLLLASSVSAKELTGALKRIADSSEIKVGFAPDARPMSFIGDDGDPTGYSISLCKAVAARVKQELELDTLKVTYVPLVLPEERMQAVENGLVDIECAASTVTLSRRERVDFSLITFITGGAVLSLRSAPIMQIENISEKTIAVIKGTTTHQKLHEFSEVNDLGYTLRLVETRAKGMELLNAKKVDGFASDRTMLLGQIRQSENAANYAISTNVFSFEPYGLMLKRGDTDFRLVVDRALASLYRTARIRRLYHDWFGRYGEPMSPIVEAVYELQAVGE